MVNFIEKNLIVKWFYNLKVPTHRQTRQGVYTNDCLIDSVMNDEKNGDTDKKNDLNIILMNRKQCGKAFSGCNLQFYDSETCG